ncbi:MAG: methylamine dehydrogenase accessory protein MauD [Actinomycetota bacterium]
MEGWWAASYVALWFLVAALCVVVVALARQIGTLHLRLGPRGALEIDQEGPALGEGRPPLETSDIEGRAVTIGGSAQLLLFVSPGCTVCERVLPSVAAVGQAFEIEPLVLTDADAEETRLDFAHKRVRAPIVAAREAFASYEVPGTPFVVVLDDVGVVRAKGTVNNLEQMEGLIDTAHNRGPGDHGAHDVEKSGERGAASAGSQDDIGRAAS